MVQGYHLQKAHPEQAEAARQLQLMIEVLKTLQRLDVEQRQMSLFGREG